jgi:uncharacterized protein YndB with AHSA1/START domain
MSLAPRHGPTVFTTPSDRELAVARSFDAPRPLVFTVWTSPEHVRRWMRGPDGWTMPVCEIDLRPGGSWRHVWRHADGTERALSGVYREVEPPIQILGTGHWESGRAETPITVYFTVDDGLTIVKTKILYPSREARDAGRASSVTGDAVASLDRLAAYLRPLNEDGNAVLSPP